MKERPILFKGEMVRAILEGRKTQTRRGFSDRLMKLFRCAALAGEVSSFLDSGVLENNDLSYIKQWCPHGKVGDRIWVKETFGTNPCYDYLKPSRLTINSFLKSSEEYRATATPETDVLKWRPSIFMPRWASRITLEITTIRVERLQDISEADALAEGIARLPGGGYGTDEPFSAENTAVCAYEYLWKKINGADSWKANPWVWVIEFKKL